MNINILNPVTYPHWNELVLGNKDHSFFHSANWAITLQEAYGFSPLYFSSIDQGMLTALIPVMEIKSILSGYRGVSLPFTDFCMPLGMKGGGLPELIDCVTDYGRKAGWEYFELRGEQSELKGLPFYRHYFTHMLDLSIGVERLSSNMRDSTKRNIRKAEKENVHVKSYTSRESVSEFCLLNNKTRKLHGLPPQPAIFFEKFYEHIISKGLGKVFLAHHNGNCIAANVYVHFGDKVIYKYGASEHGQQHLRANNLVMWEAIKSFCNDGYSQLSFGRTEPENAGLRQFKAGWGVEELIVKYYRYDLRHDLFMPETGNCTYFYTQILKVLPVPVLKTIGKLFYKHVG